MIDFHSHIMPAFDDGASDADTSLKMINTIVSTSHCYPCSSADIDKFLSERERAYDELMAAAQNSGVDMPEIRLGCEVHLTCDLTRLRGIEKLCIDKTGYMLVEMPSSNWNDNTIDYIYKLSISGIKPIIAHAERNIAQKSELLSALYTLDILIQINAESFGAAPLKKFIDNMMKNKMIHIIGTDMHNLNTRHPNMDKAKKYIIKRYGAECWSYLMRNADIILEGEELYYRDLMSFKKKSFLSK